MKIKIFSNSISIIVLTFGITTMVAGQWNPGANQTWGGDEPIIQQTHPELAFNSLLSDNSTSLRYRFNGNSRALFTYRNDGSTVDEFRMSTVSDVKFKFDLLNSTVKIDDKKAVQYDGTRMVWGDVGFTSNYFPNLVGIGKMTPAALLHLDGGGNTNLRLESTTNFYLDFYKGTTRAAYLNLLNTSMALVNEVSGGQMNVVSDSHGNYLSESGDLRFNTVSHSNNRMTIKNNGFVGIGTENPTQDLEIHPRAGDNNVDIKLVGTNNQFVRFDNGTIQTGYIGTVGDNGAYVMQTDNPDGFMELDSETYMRFAIRNAAAMTINTDLNVGIGTAFPAYKLQVDGNVDIIGELTAESDMRLKEDIEDVSGAIETIKKLKPKTYNFKTEEFPTMELSERTKMGFLAQEMEEVLPELVSVGGEVTSTTGESFNAMSVNYIEVIPLLTKAIQEQQAMIEDLIKEVKLLKGE